MAWLVLAWSQPATYVTCILHGFSRVWAPWGRQFARVFAYVGVPTLGKRMKVSTRSVSGMQAHVDMAHIWAQSTRFASQKRAR